MSWPSTTPSRSARELKTVISRLRVNASRRSTNSDAAVWVRSSLTSSLSSAFSSSDLVPDTPRPTSDEIAEIPRRAARSRSTIVPAVSRRKTSLSYATPPSIDATKLVSIGTSRYSGWTRSSLALLWEDRNSSAPSSATLRRLLVAEVGVGPGFASWSESGQPGARPARASSCASRCRRPLPSAHSACPKRGSGVRARRPPLRRQRDHELSARGEGKDEMSRPGSRVVTVGFVVGPRCRTTWLKALRLQ